MAKQHKTKNKKKLVSQKDTGAIIIFQLGDPKDKSFLPLSRLLDRLIENDSLKAKKRNKESRSKKAAAKAAPKPKKK